MYDTVLFESLTTTLVLVLMLSLPAILAATVVGLLVSLVQALTQIQDQTLTHAVKLIVVMAALGATVPLMGAQFIAFSERMFSDMLLIR